MKTLEIKAWLEKNKCVNVKPCRVTIGNETWLGCEYQQQGEWQAGMQGVIDGTHKVGETYLTNRRFYLIGKLPKVYKRRRNNCFVFVLDNNSEWYLSGHIQDVKPAFAEFHPYGANFMLGHWDAAGKVDDGERFPYHRFPMSVEYFDIR